MHVACPCGGGCRRGGAGSVAWRDGGACSLGWWRGGAPADVGVHVGADAYDGGVGAVGADACGGGVGAVGADAYGGGVGSVVASGRVRLL